MADTVQPVKLTPEQIAKHKAEMERYRALTGGELAREVMTLIEENLERWEQGSWRQDNGDDAGQVCSAPVTAIEAFAEDPLNPACTTSFCYAGWVGAVKGVKWARGNTELIGNPLVCKCKGFCCEVPEHQIHIGNWAGQQLGLETYDADKLFHGDNSLYTLQQYTEEIVTYGEITSDGGDEDDDDSDY
jgi:hypothetical protein